MSKDFQIAFPCPHLIVEERVDLGADRKTLKLSSPIASYGSINILMNDAFYAPPEGLYSRAVLRSSISGPYRIVKNEETFVIRNTSEVHTVTLPKGLRITTDTLVSLFNQTFRAGKKYAGIVAINLKGHLVFYDTSASGGSSRLNVDGAGYQALGFSKKSGAQGRETFPRWDLVVDENTTERFIKFRKPIKTNPLIKVTYATLGNFCKRCGGTYVENDFRYDLAAGGDLILIENENLLYQSCLKALLTDVGSNPYHRWYGTNLMGAIGKKAVLGMQVSIKKEVSDVLRRVQSAQTAQMAYQDVPNKERLFNLLSVEVSPHEFDPTTFMIEVVVQNASRTPINLTIVYTAPNAVALAGSNNRTLGLN